VRVDPRYQCCFFESNDTLAVALLYVHRAFFAQGLSDHPLDPLRGTYAPSILSGYRSACQIISNLRAAFTAFPKRVARFWVLWTHAFSASVKLPFHKYSLARADSIIR
jgi:hypothetical protein